MSLAIKCSCGALFNTAGIPGGIAVTFSGNPDEPRHVTDADIWNSFCRECPRALLALLGANECESGECSLIAQLPTCMRCDRCGVLYEAEQPGAMEFTLCLWNGNALNDETYENFCVACAQGLCAHVRLSDVTKAEWHCARCGKVDRDPDGVSATLNINDVGHAYCGECTAAMLDYMNRESQPA